MTSCARLVLLRLLTAVACGSLIQAADVGSGAPTNEIRLSFLEAYFRGRFPLRAAAPPPAEVRRFGANGYVQEFPDPTRPGFNSALVNFGAGVNTGGVTVQVLSRLFRFWAPPGANQTSGLNTYGFPVRDAVEFSASAPGRDPVAGEWQEFQNSAAIFSWAMNPEGAGDADLVLQGAFYARWVALGRDAGLGFAVSSAATVRSPRGGQALAQRFTRGGLYQWTTGSLNGQMFAVQEPFYTAYRGSQGESGFLGLPLGEQRVLPNNRREQSFEGGTLDLTGGAVTVRPRVIRVRLIGSNPLRLNAGESAAIRAEMETLGEQIVTDRLVNFTTGSQTVATVSPTGLNTAAVRGVGSGTTTISAVCEGVTSNAITVIVAAPCCRLGEGAPAVVGEAMLAAISRNRISIRMPVAGPARRAGNGWVQEAVSTDGLLTYLVTKADNSSTAYLLTGDLRQAWEAAGAAAGVLGFPISDRSPGGRQDFENGSLAGRPARLVMGLIRSRWQAEGSEGGPLGNPVGDAAPYLSFAGSAGLMQRFEGGLIVTSASRALAVSGAIGDRYLALGGPEGNLGAPVSEPAAGRQTFEGGTVTVSGGVALVAELPRRPRLSVQPGVVAPANRLTVTLGGFLNGARVRVTFPGGSAPPFLAPVPTGAFRWELLIPADARPGVFTIRAEDLDRPEFTAQTSYTVAAPAGVDLRKLMGDNQIVPPGALAPEPLRVVVVDAQGVRLAGQRVRWEVSPGGILENAQTVTDAAGEASARLRLPRRESLVVVSVTAGGDVETFSARSAALGLANFPRLRKTPATSALLAATASVLRYRQQQGQIPAAGGWSDVETLDEFLNSFCVAEAATGQICDGYLTRPPERYVNFWRLAAFTGGGLRVETGIGGVREWLAAGDPVIALLLYRGQSHAVVATGVADNGAILVHDPDPALALTHLDAYFEAGAELLDMVRLQPGAPEAGGFLLFGSGPVKVSSAGRACQELRYALGTAAIFCDGSAPAYQADPSPRSEASLTSLDSPGRITALPPRPVPYRIYRQGPFWTAEPLRLAVEPGSVVNAANFRPGIAPGGAATLFGLGLNDAAVELGGVPAVVLFRSPFQLNFVVPPETAPGIQTLRLRGASGEVAIEAFVAPHSPAIFRLADGGAAITHRDGTLNRPSNPVRRGEAVTIYATGLGQTEPRPDGLAEVRAEVRIVARGAEYPVLFAGLAPGFVGLYQVNWAVPADLAPGVLADLRLRQGNAVSLPVEVAVQ